MLSKSHSALLMTGEKTMKLLCTTVFALAITTASFADTWTVGWSLNNPFPDFDNIQDAVDYADNGDEINCFFQVHIQQAVVRKL